MQEFSLSTPAEGFIDITGKVNEALSASGIKNGICLVFVPHTTAGVTINENADPAVVTDMLAAFSLLVPDIAYRHQEGNSPAHIKASLVGSSVSLPVINGTMRLGTWQGIYFCEFDGPRRRRVCVSFVGG
ncbi:MAG TPA: secondary thiamine-phosphate synthase enzyme YjbQ [Methylomusa anaerophila]|uniref:Secondary thiamine-phosphate synthase enzyme n=1 Tax=Methylomusa anaerophila TaxID=1930071 RepID=A0A348AJD2_9FIRM|nr:secondary thiamine-phosphate synthase enzyme YjbQ [Methylomusa anaerophila]BBB91180.1 hypothetical protein MAMMFC1_01851 [Methylomusa anaerophila]HML89057.1 secondary thiamine-phosphate synthase enzyme YjbQ [Methylomusa anaerophila]